MTLNVIDESRYQSDLDINKTGADAGIVGCTYGTAGVNPYAGPQLNAVKAAGKLRGAYHIRAGDGPTAAAEAQAFLDFITPYIDGKTVLILDWEECTLSNVPWALAWLDYVYAKTGIRPIIYMSASVSLAYDWSSVRANYGLWVAQYPYNTVTGFIGVNWTPPATSWPVLVGWQYAGTGGAVGGYTGVDLSVFYITAAQWIAYATPNISGQSSTVTPISGGPFMALTDAEQATLLSLVTRINGYIDSKISDVPSHVWTYPVHYATGDVSAVQTLANGTTAATAAAAQTADIITAGGTSTLRQVTADGTRAAQAAQATAAALAGTVAPLPAAVAAVPAAVLNQQFTTAAGVTTNVPGLLDAINTKPVAAVALTPDQISQLAATLKSELPTATLQALATAITTNLPA